MNRRSIVLMIAAFLYIVFVASIANAQGGGPPVITDDTGTVPKGHWEINTAFTIEHTSGGRLFGTPLLDINYGLSKSTQLKVEVPIVTFHPSGARRIGGLGNTNVGVRWRFRDEDEHHRVALSIYPQFEFNNPTASVRRGIVDRGPEFLLPMQLQTQVGKIGINGDIGYRLKRGTDEIIYGVVFGRTFRERFDLLGEIHTSQPSIHFSQAEVVYNLGSRVKLTNHLTLLLAAGRSLRNGRDPKFIGYAGLQTTF